MLVQGLGFDLGLGFKVQVCKAGALFVTATLSLLSSMRNKTYGRLAAAVITFYIRMMRVSINNIAITGTVLHELHGLGWRLGCGLIHV